MQKYRADRCKVQSDGAIVWYAEWMGGRSLAKVENCLLSDLEGDMRRTVYALGEPDTFFSIPAACKLMGKRVSGYLTSEDGNLVFRHGYY